MAFLVGDETIYNILGTPFGLENTLARYVSLDKQHTAR
jgi:hypothetical protein